MSGRFLAALPLMIFFGAVAGLVAYFAIGFNMPRLYESTAVFELLPSPADEDAPGDMDGGSPVLRVPQITSLRFLEKVSAAVREDLPTFGPGVDRTAYLQKAIVAERLPESNKVALRVRMPGKFDARRVTEEVMATFARENARIPDETHREIAKLEKEIETELAVLEPLKIRARIHNEVVKKETEESKSDNAAYEAELAKFRELSETLRFRISSIEKYYPRLKVLQSPDVSEQPMYTETLPFLCAGCICAGVLLSPLLALPPISIHRRIKVKPKTAGQSSQPVNHVESKAAPSELFPPLSASYVPGLIVSLVVCIIVGNVAADMITANQPRIYQVTTVFTVVPAEEGPGQADAAGVDKTSIGYLKSRAFLGILSADLGGKEKPDEASLPARMETLQRVISVEVTHPDSRQFTVRVNDRFYDEAYAIARQFVDSYTSQIKALPEDVKSRLEKLNEELAVETKTLREIEGRQVLRREANKRYGFGGVGFSPERDPDEAGDVKREPLAKARSVELKAMIAAEQARAERLLPHLRLDQEALYPQKPFFPDPVRNAKIGLLAALLAAPILAFPAAMLVRHVSTWKRRVSARPATRVASQPTMKTGETEW